MFDEKVEKAIQFGLGLANANEQLEVQAYANKDFEASTTSGVLDQCESSESFGFGVQIIEDGKTGFSRSTSLDQDSIKECIDLARENLKFSSADSNKSLPTEAEVELTNQNALGEVVMDFADKDFHKVTIEEKLNMIMELEARSENNEKVDSVMQTGYGDSLYTSGFANTVGIEFYEYGSHFSIGQYLTTKSKTEKGAGTGGAFLGRQNFAELNDYLNISDECVYDATLIADAEPIKTSTQSVVFHQEVVAGILSTIIGMCNPDYVIKNSSLVSQKLGSQIANSKVTIFDNPTDVAGRGYTAYDGDGLRTSKNFLIKNGDLEGFFHNAYTARKLGHQVNGCAVSSGVGASSNAGAHCLFFVDSNKNDFILSDTYDFEAGEFASKSKPLDALLKDLGNGLFVTEVSGWHSGVNAQTGTFSLGAKGVVVRNGELAESFSEVTISTTLFDLLNNIESFGQDYTERNSGSVLSSLLVSNISVGGV